jgi:hypothetical protein
MTSGAPPTMSISASTSLMDRANLVTGRPMPARARSWRLRSSSRERAMDWDVLAG